MASRTDNRQPEHTHWKCQFCDAINKMEDKYCSDCQTRRDAGAIAVTHSSTNHTVIGKLGCVFVNADEHWVYDEDALTRVRGG